MHNVTATLAALFAVTLVSVTPSISLATNTADDTTVSNVSDKPFSPFSDGSLKGWKTRSLEGNSEYDLVADQGVQVLQGRTEKQASIFYKEEKIFLEKTPVINWSWKVQDIYRNIDEKTRAGDDYPARLYVAVKTGLLPWETLAINYVWSSEHEVGDAWPNPFTEKAHMVSVHSGESDIGKWVSHSRNVHEDFQKYFNVNVKNLSGYAVMIDGDNAEVDGTAWFGGISFTETYATN